MNNIKQPEIRKAIKNEISINFYLVAIPLPFTMILSFLLNKYGYNFPDFYMILLAFSGLIMQLLLFFVFKRYYRIIKRTENFSSKRKIKYSVETCLSLNLKLASLNFNRRKWKVKRPGKVKGSLIKAQEYFDEKTLQTYVTNDPISPIRISRKKPTFSLKWNGVRLFPDLYFSTVGFAFGCIWTPIFFIMLGLNEYLGLPESTPFVLVPILFGLERLILYIDIKCSNRYLRVSLETTKHGNKSTEELRMQSFITSKSNTWVENNSHRIKWKNINYDDLGGRQRKQYKSEAEYLLWVLSKATYEYPKKKSEPCNYLDENV